jgi:hypothetical protein
MDKASELVILSGEVHRHVREIAPDISDEEHKMIVDLLNCVLKFPIVRFDDGDASSWEEEERD